jgi:hypothetical protein
VTPDGGILASQPAARRLVAYTGKDAEQILASDTGIKDITVGQGGLAYFTDPGSRAVKSMDAKGKVTVLDTGIEYPNGVCLSPDQGLLYVSDMVGQFVYSFQIALDGTLTARQPYYHLHLTDDPRGGGADGMCVDTQGRLYVATPAGIQFCDQAGRVNGIIGRPEHDGWISDVCLGGKDRDELYVTAGNKLWKRKVKARGVLPFAEPVLPPPPRRKEPSRAARAVIAPVGPQAPPARRGVGLVAVTPRRAGPSCGRPGRSERLDQAEPVHATFDQTSGTKSVPTAAIAISGRDRLEPLVAISWNAWSPSAGLAGRHHWNAHMGLRNRLLMPTWDFVGLATHDRRGNASAAASNLAFGSGGFSRSSRTRRLSRSDKRRCSASSITASAARTALRTTKSVKSVFLISLRRRR